MVANTLIKRCVAIKFIVNQKEPLDVVVPVDDSMDELSPEEIGRTIKNIKKSIAFIKENDPEFYGNIEDGSVLYQQFNCCGNVRIDGDKF